MINFGAIEWVSYQHLLILETSREAFNQNLKILFGTRVERIVALLDASTKLDSATKQDVKLLSNEAIELSVWRNRIAHNPILPTWKPGSDSEKAPPDLIGVPDMRQLKNADFSNSISIDGITKLVEASVDIGQRLHEASQRLKGTA